MTTAAQVHSRGTSPDGRSSSSTLSSSPPHIVLQTPEPQHSTCHSFHGFHGHHLSAIHDDDDDDDMDIDPLVALEHHLLARPPGFHPLLRSFSLPATTTSITLAHLAAPAEAEAEATAAEKVSSPSRSHSRSPAPTPGARRCMAATAAWTPRLDRRQSFDGQAYRRVMMARATGMVEDGVFVDPECDAPDDRDSLCLGGLSLRPNLGHDLGHGYPHCLEHHHHHVHEPCHAYEADRGFSECMRRGST